MQQKDESQIIADERFQEILFQGTPYDHPVYGTLESLPGLAVRGRRISTGKTFCPRKLYGFSGRSAAGEVLSMGERELPSVSRTEKPAGIFSSFLSGSRPGSSTARN